MKQVHNLKKELLAAIVSLTIAAVCLTSATYAWYVANNTVTAATASISAKTNGFILQIATLEEGAQHGGEQKSLEAFSTGATLSPASSNDLKNWYVCQSWDDQGYVTGYSTPDFTGTKPGLYQVGGKDYYAYIRSDYILYTITATGTADIYLEGSESEPPIVVTTRDGRGVSTVIDSLRVAITTQAVGSDGHTAVGDETLRVVYAASNETGKGNDKNGINGWTYVSDPSTVSAVTYPHIYGTTSTDQNGKNWVATKSGENFTVPGGSLAIAENVGYDGIVVHVYIWMEGTDADCVNGKSIEDDTSKYDVTVKFAGVATSTP